MHKLASGFAFLKQCKKYLFKFQLMGCFFQQLLFLKQNCGNFTCTNTPGKKKQQQSFQVIWVEIHLILVLTSKFRSTNFLRIGSSSSEAKVESVLKNHEWHWRPARSEDMVQKKARPGAIKREGWSHLVSMVYTCAATWDEIRKKDEGHTMVEVNLVFRCN